MTRDGLEPHYKPSVQAEPLWERNKNFYRRHFLKEASMSNVASVIERSNKIHRPGLCLCENSNRDRLQQTGMVAWCSRGERGDVGRSAGSRSGPAHPESAQHSWCHRFFLPTAATQTLASSADWLVCFLTALTRITRFHIKSASTSCCTKRRRHRRLPDSPPTTVCLALKPVYLPLQKHSKHENRVRKAKLATRTPFCQVY